MFILCHKCSGVLSHTADESDHINHLSCCVCISGWVRSFEPHLDFPTAVAKQIEAAEYRIKLYANQGRPMAAGSSEHQRIDRLKIALSDLVFVPRS